jgi:hypothetical protein
MDIVPLRGRSLTQTMINNNYHQNIVLDKEEKLK